jgi:hypothetical protein
LIPPLSSILVLAKIERQQREDKAEQKRHARSQRRTNWLLTIFTGLLFVTSFVSDVLILRQINVAKLSAEAAKTAAEQAKRSADAAEKGSEAAKSAAATADNSLQRSIESFRIDERAWIEIDRIDRIMESARSDKFGAAFRYRLYPRNVGKTAAHDIMVRAARNVMSSIDLESNIYGMRSTQERILLNRSPKNGPGPAQNPVPKVLAPGVTAAVPFVMDGQEPQVFPKSEWVSYLIGRIDYADDFGVKHWMKFCFYVAQTNGELWNCHEGNDEDNNPETPAKTPDTQR